MGSELVNAVKIFVDCEKNTEEGIEAGGLQTLGYIFLVPAETHDEMKNFIRKELKKNTQPLMSIYSQNIPVQKSDALFTKERISALIQKGYKKEK